MNNITEIIEYIENYCKINNLIFATNDENISKNIIYITISDANKSSFLNIGLFSTTISSCIVENQSIVEAFDDKPIDEYKSYLDTVICIYRNMNSIEETSDSVDIYEELQEFRSCIQNHCDLLNKESDNIEDVEKQSIVLDIANNSVGLAMSIDDALKTFKLIDKNEEIDVTDDLNNVNDITMKLEVSKLLTLLKKYKDHVSESAYTNFVESAKALFSSN